MLDDDAPAPVVASKAKATPKEVKAASAPPKKEARPSSRGGRGRGEGRGRGRGKGRGDRKREFDRTSGDRRAKKDGAGKYNWGKEGEDDKPRRNNDRKVEADKEEATDDAEKVEEVEEEPERAPRQEEPEEEVEPPTMTYEEYHASKEVCEEDLALKVRQVDLDDSQFKSTTDVPEEVADSELGYMLGGGKKQLKKGAGKKAKKVISFDEFAAKAPAGRNNDRSSRGGKGDSRGKGKGKGRGKGDSRGGRGRPTGRGGNFNLAAAKNDFPTLGA